MSKTEDLIFDGNPASRDYTRQYQKEETTTLVIEVLPEDPENPKVGQIWMIDDTTE
jgi:hypothetical protein